LTIQLQEKNIYPANVKRLVFYERKPKEPKIQSYAVYLPAQTVDVQWGYNEQTQNHWIRFANQDINSKLHIIHNEKTRISQFQSIYPDNIDSCLKKIISHS